MEHRSLTQEIASKGKKHMENFEPAFFSEIPYENVTEINYLRDLEEKKQSLDFPIFEFQKDFGEQAPANEFDMLANTLYKKIMQQGYIQQKKAPSKKKKKTKNPLEYDYEDEWINDQEAITVKKNIYVKVQNFKCFSQGIEDFYNSELYKTSLSQIQQQSKKKTNEITMKPHQLEEIKKKIKENISMAHNRVKEEIEAEKPTMITDILEENGKQVKNQGNQQNENDSNLIKTENFKGDEVQSQISESKENSGPKSESKSSKNSNLEQKSKKSAKVPPKTKNVKKPIKAERKLKEKPKTLNKTKTTEAKPQPRSELKDSLAHQAKQPEGQNIQMAENGIAELKLVDEKGDQNQKQQMIEEEKE